MDYKSEKINFSIAIFNLITIATANEKFFHNSFSFSDKFIPSMIFLLACSFLSILTIFKRNIHLLLINHIFFAGYLFYFFQNNYMAQSYIFWINGLLLWLTLNLFHKKITYETRLNSVQFYLISCYCLAGFQKLYNIFSTKHVFTNKLGLISSLLSDYIFLFKEKSHLIDIMYDHSLLVNILIGGIMLIQIALIFFYSKKNKLKLTIALFVFHVTNSILLGISFIHAIYMLMIFFIIPLVKINDLTVSLAEET